jgi:uncharacterized protein
MLARRHLIVSSLAAIAAFGLTGPLAAQTAKPHRVVIHVDDNDAARMNLALNNATNITQYYSGKGETVEIEIVTYGPGLHMLRADTSPVKDRIKTFDQSMPNVTFAACENTRAGMKRTENKEIELLTEAKSVPSGVVHMIERQEQGWSYIRP